MSDANAILSEERLLLFQKAVRQGYMFDNRDAAALICHIAAQAERLAALDATHQETVLALSKEIDARKAGEEREQARAEVCSEASDEDTETIMELTSQVAALQAKVERLEAALHATDQKVMAASKATHPKARAILIDEAHDILLRAALEPKS